MPELITVPPEPRKLDVEDSYSLEEKLGFLGAVYDQDTDNLGAQTRGFKAMATIGSIEAFDAERTTGRRTRKGWTNT